MSLVNNLVINNIFHESILAAVNHEYDFESGPTKFLEMKMVDNNQH